MRNKKPVVVLINGKARHGKNTLAYILQNILSRKNIKSYIEGNASAVKQLALTEFKWNGLKDDRGRQLLIDITNSGYNYDPFFWEKKTEHSASKIFNLDVLIIPDWRYLNTKKYFKDRGYEVCCLHIEREKAIIEMNQQLQNDISEKGFDISEYDYKIYNKSDDLDHLKQLVQEFIVPIITKHITK